MPVKTDPTKKPDGTKVETPAATEVQDSNTPPADNGAENSGGGLPDLIMYRMEVPIR